jgi:O-antigen/teichoic acid export membrane protein
MISPGTDLRPLRVHARDEGHDPLKIRSNILSRLPFSSLKRNAAFSVAQTLFVTTCLFAVYRLTISEVGLELTGLWSLLLAGATVARVADFSGGATLSRFVAIKLHQQRENHQYEDRCAVETVHTTLLSSLGLNIIIACALLISAPILLPIVVGAELRQTAFGLMPFIAAMVVAVALATGVTSAIDGAFRADLRAIVMMASSLLFLIAAYILVPRYGVYGFAFANVIQQIAATICGWIFLGRLLPNLGAVPTRWRKTAFFETIGYAIRLNSIGAATALFEPLAKFSLNSASGTALVALYDVSSKLVTQIRSLAVSAAQPLLPAIAAGPSTTSASFRKILADLTKFSIIAAIGVAFSCSLAAPIGAKFFFDSSLAVVQSQFLAITFLLTLGWSLNLFSLGFYTAAQAVGLLRWNLLGHLVLAGCIVFGASIVVPIYGARGILICVGVGLAASSAISILGNARSLGALGVVRSVAPWILVGASLIFGIVGIVGGLVLLR